ncbi:hypothetical protein [Arcobacter ellisii]|uniref:NERD domain-containing protein n=1 Tax=Arcobacter ellisii TaxID=913109 RepID=A0A347UA58_9BACT|nr:hypothetical protein [Arcobacter ellisii]AXX95736.1 hypothetical protein AELL_2094 [Arcobacter ellisii]RXI31392.1 hypothetical protein CP962_04570 [Arcobacter ellisii]
MNINYTHIFIDLVNELLASEQEYFQKIKTIKETKKSFPELRKIILNDYNISIESYEFNDNELFKNHIKQFILDSSDIFDINVDTLFNISKQVQVEYLLENISEKDAKLYYALANTLRDYGIYRDEKIVSFKNKNFWLQLLKKLYLLNYMSTTGFIDDFEGMYHMDKSIPEFVESIKFFKNHCNLDIYSIDYKIVFNKKQEEKIVSVIEKKLRQIDIFEFLSYVLHKSRLDKKIPFNYIINLSLKNIYQSNFKKTDDKTFSKTLEVFIHFINLYQLRQVSQWDYVFIDAKNIEEKLKKQIQHSSLYVLSYPLHTHTLISYVNNLAKDIFSNNDFYNKFKFTKEELITFLLNLEKTNDYTLIKIDKIQVNELQHILNFFSIDAKEININYSLPLNTSDTKNLFIHNPIIKYKNDYYIVGFKFFKMYFYNTLVEKTRLNINKNINGVIGNRIDDYVESIFSKRDSIQIFTGKYKISKNMIPECDLVIKTDDKIIFIENKNKYLTKDSFAGSSVHILQDFIRSFATSQFQLFRHEKYLKENSQIKFLDGKVLNYNDERIIKISLSPNNWYSIMSNINPNILLALMQIRFAFKEYAKAEEIKEFEATNKDLEKLTNMIEEIDKKLNFRT